METIFIPHSDYLEHHGIKGQKWGLRRYQNLDGSYTAEGRKRYLDSEGNMTEKGKRREARDIQKELNRLDKQVSDSLSVRERSARDLASTTVKLDAESRKHGDQPRSYQELSRKERRLINKGAKAEKSYSKGKYDAEYGEELMWMLVGDAAKKGYTVNSKPVMRMAKDLRVAQFLGGSIASTSLYSVRKAMYGSDAAAGMVGGAKYKVRNDPNKTGTIKLASYNNSSDIPYIIESEWKTD